MAVPCRLVFVVGPGRSGTSTMAGALARCGYAVPDPITADETNPAGFFEPRWVVDLHRELLERSGVRTLDADPAALSHLDSVTVDEAVRGRLRDWLRDRFTEHERLVVKDPRMVWFRDLWASVATDLGVEPAFVVMVRHPAEVSASRAEFYDATETTAVAGWINVALMTERLTAGSRRSFVRYADLTADWRTQLTRTRELLGLQLDPPPEARPHPVDDFVDPSLRRREPSWDSMPVPGYLRELGDRTYAALASLADEEGTDETGTEDRLGPLREEYARVHRDALAVAHSSIFRVRQETQRRTAQRVRARTRAQLEASGAGSTESGDKVGPWWRRRKRTG